ncbi:MAG: site-specific integrase [Polynucleobacter sp.]|nr:site-specific integrase [Polynucleobacter sp.]
MTITLPSYLHRNRHGIFGFRLVVPTRLRRHFETKHYRFSLGTTNKNRAKSLALKLASLTWQTYQSMSHMSDDDAKIAARDLVASINAELDAALSIPPELELLSQTASLEQFTAYLRKSVEGRSTDDALRLLGEHAIELAEREFALKAKFQRLSKRITDSISGDMALLENDDQWEAHQNEVLDYERGKIQFERDCHAFTLAVSRIRMHLVFEDERSKLTNEHESKLSDAAKFASLMMSHAPTAPTSAPASAAAPSTPSPSATAHPPTPAKTEKVMLSSVIEAFCGSRIAEKNWSAKTEAENRAIYALWLDIVGDQPIETYGYEQHRDYKTRLMKLPPNINKKPVCKGKSIDQIIAMKLPPMNVTTANKNLGRVGSLFGWAVAHGYTTLNPASSMTIPAQRSAKEQRDVFSEADLMVLFGTNEYAKGRHANSYMHWIPLIGYYSGARLNEIAQLHLTDFVEVDGISMFSFNPDGEHKKIKTRAGVRKVPVHPELIRLGLLAHVESLRDQGKDRLFPELKPGRDGYGQLPSKWFARYKTRCKITAPGKVFHSFRHTFVTCLMQADVPKERIAALVGHEDDSETFGRYGKSFNASTLLEDVSRIPSTVTRHVLVIGVS